MRVVAHAPLTAATILALASAACGGSGLTGGPSPFVAECPLAAGAVGYPIAARMESSGVADTAYLNAFARAVAYRWRVPSVRRGSYANWEDVRSRVLPPEPRWADDWRPSAAHQATLGVWLDRQGRVLRTELRQPSGDELFDRSLTSALDDPLPGSPELPMLRAISTDSVLLVLSFGDGLGADSSDSPAGVARFAVQQSPPRVDRGTVRFDQGRPVPTVGPQPRPAAATVKYDVDAAGGMIPGSFQVLETSSDPYARMIEDGLRHARFTPAQSNCRAVPLTVLQSFRGGGSP